MFDFIYTFQDWLLQFLTPLLTWVYDPVNGTYYDFQTAQVIQIVAYLLFVIAFMVVVWFVLAFVKSAYYFVKELF